MRRRYGGREVMLRLLKTCGVWLLSLLIIIAPAVLQAIGAIKD